MLRLRAGVQRAQNAGEEDAVPIQIVCATTGEESHASPTASFQCSVFRKGNRSQILAVLFGD